MEALHPHHRHGCQEDEEEDDGGGNGSSPRDQFLDLDDLGFLSIEGIDRNRRTILRVVAERERKRKEKQERNEAEERIHFSYIAWHA